MTRVHLRRLLKLAAFLEKLPRKRFNYGSWVGDDWAGEEDLSCGTTACALGWACTMPEFRRLGLRLRGSHFCGDLVGIPAMKDAPADLSDYWARVEQPKRAAWEIFGLSEDEHAELFDPLSSWHEQNGGPGEEATPKQAARFIRKFVARKAKEMGVEAPSS